LIQQHIKYVIKWNLCQSLKHNFIALGLWQASYVSQPFTVIHCRYIVHFQALLEDIQKYQATLDDVKAKGHGQIERYIGTTPSIQETREKQLRTVQDSYNSLLHTALQIKVVNSASLF
jgi:hypothetical protein